MTIPMAIEESSVVAAAANAAKFWATKGGFKARVFEPRTKEATTEPEPKESRGDSPARQPLAYLHDVILRLLGE